MSSKPPLPETLNQDASKIEGNASLEVKEFIAGIFWNIMTNKMNGYGFAYNIGRRLFLREISFLKKVEEPDRMEGRVVVEITVDEDMVNSLDNMHGGCSAYLVDVCSTMALSAFEMSTGRDGGPSVSQALNIVYHSPAMLGDKLRIVNTTITVGGRAMSARTEIWNDTHHRQVATGIHIKMHPSPPKLKAHL